MPILYSYKTLLTRVSYTNLPSCTHCYEPSLYYLPPFVYSGIINFIQIRRYAIPAYRSDIYLYFIKRIFLWNEFIPESASITKNPTLGVFSHKPFNMYLDFETIKERKGVYNSLGVNIVHQNDVFYKEIYKYLYFAIPGIEYTMYIKVKGDKLLAQTYKYAFEYQTICDRDKLALKIALCMIEIYNGYSNTPYPVGRSKSALRRSYKAFSVADAEDMKFNKLELIGIPTTNINYMPSNMAMEDRLYFTDLPEGLPSYEPLYLLNLVKNDQLHINVFMGELEEVINSIPLGIDCVICITLESNHYSKHFVKTDDSQECYDYLLFDLTSKVDLFVKDWPEGVIIKIGIYTALKYV